MSAPARSTLLLGGARSGKSRWGERLIERAARPVYIATARIEDPEMHVRVAAHRARRGARWRLVEEPAAVAEALEAASAPDVGVLVDCLTIWLSNLFFDERDWHAEVAKLCAASGRAAGPVVFVASELGLGLVPETKLGRGFRDAAGLMHQRVASACDQVALIVAGLPLTLKGPPLAIEDAP